MSAINIHHINFHNEVLNSDKPVLLDFWAPWCGPCRRVVPLVEEIAEERSDIKVGKVNVEEQPELARQFGVKSIPMLVVMKDGEVIKRSVGAKNKSAILTATPDRTWSSMRLLSWSIILLVSSTPRLTGPGCMMIAFGFAYDKILSSTP